MVESKVKAYKQLWRVSCKDDFIALAKMESLDGLQNLCNDLAMLINHMVDRSIGMAPIDAYLGGTGRQSPAQLKLLGDALSQVGSALPVWETADPTKHAHRLASIHAIAAVRSAMESWGSAADRDRTHELAEVYQPADIVLVYVPSPDVATPIWQGPFCIASAGQSSAYYVVEWLEDDGTTERSLRTVQVSQLKRFNASRYTTAQLLSNEAEGIYMVERIVSHHGAGPDVQFEVKGAGYDGTTLSAPSLIHLTTAFKSYAATHGLKPSQFELTNSWHVPAKFQLK